jgi:hypothetical protein
VKGFKMLKTGRGNIQKLSLKRLLYRDPEFKHKEQSTDGGEGDVPALHQWISVCEIIWSSYMS